MRQTKKITLCAILTALSVVLLTLGTLTQVLDLSMAAIVSLFVVLIRIELGGVYPYLFWAATSLATYLILPAAEGAGLIFAALGLYPLLKAVLERLPRVIEWICKVLLGAAIIAIFVVLAKFVFLLPDEILSGFMLPVFCVVALFAFVLYDIALSRMIVFYSLRIRPQIERFLK